MIDAKARAREEAGYARCRANGDGDGAAWVKRGSALARIFGLIDEREGIGGLAIKLYLRSDAMMPSSSFPEPPARLILEPHPTEATGRVRGH